MTVGPRGASLSFGSRGTYLNAGVPGTGLYSRTRLSSSTRRADTYVSPPRPTPAPAWTVQVALRVDVEDDGRVTFKNKETGELVDERIAEQAKRQKGAELRALMDKFAKDANEQVEALEHIHWQTPDPSTKPSYEVKPFDEPEPQLPPEPTMSFLDRSLPWRREAIERRYSTDLAKALSEQDDWIRRKAEFAGRQVRRKIFVQNDIYKDAPAMESFLAEHLQAIAWPRETSVTFQIEEHGEKVLLDVDLPEVENMPKKTWAPAARGFKLLVKDISESRIRQIYVDHVHGIGFRLIGEAFAALPRCNEVVLSGYSQRADPKTGRIRNDYLYSVHVSRGQWERINFHGLHDVNVVDALASFELRRDMSKKGIFSPIIPLA